MADTPHGKHTVGEIKQVFGDCYAVGELYIMYGKNLNILILTQHSERWLSEHHPDLLESIKLGKS